MPFLQLIQNEAGQNGYIVLDLPEQQGVVVLPDDYSTRQKIDLLQQLIMDLRSTTPRTPMAEMSPSPTEMDCQVTVEERAQLFKFLHS